MKPQRKLPLPALLALLAVLILAVGTLSLNLGLIRISPVDVLKTLMGAGTPRQELVLFQIRLPRMVIAALVGAGLSVSGAIMQGVSRNNLADPGILGIGSGAGLAVMIYVTFVPATAMRSILLMPLLAFAGAAVAAGVIYLLAWRRGATPTRLLLVGIGVGAAFSAAILLFQTRLNPRNFATAAVWLAGSIWGTNWKFVLALLPWVLLLVPFALRKAQVLNVLGLGDEVARGLGAAVERERVQLLGAAVGLAAASVAVGGGIGFLGLIGPHLARQLVGPKHERLIPTASLTGALLLMVADVFAVNLMAPTEIPTGIVVAVVGAPYFLYLLSRS